MDLRYGWNADDMTVFPAERDGEHSGRPEDDGDPTGRTHRMWAEPLTALGEEFARAGARAHAYRLDWRPPGSGYDATHCLDPRPLSCRRAPARDRGTALSRP
ncbi:hypothetical protein [Streptomyces sp. NPDC006267]|uniref:hypothetical protein n=1 Tax=Streptomyces sp. NPDC006267 TaxID=3157173 RepID=UPI0033AC5B1E